MSAYINRTIEEQLKQYLAYFPVVILTGPRQTGKSTLVYQMKNEGFSYVSLDSLEERELAQQDPKYFIERYGLPLIIDEIQYAPKLLEVIEEIVNKRRIEQDKSNGLFILTGSQSYSLMRGVTQSLAGRAGILEMMPLSEREIIQKEELPFLPSLNKLTELINPDWKTADVFRRIVRGYYPELYKNPELPERVFYENYISTYIERDVSELIQVTNKLPFKNFMQYLATIISSPLNFENIARAVGVNVKTVKGWISILEASGIIFLLQPYSEDKLTKRIVKSPKIYFCDTGLAAYLARIYSPENLEISAMAGPYMENYVINEIRKSYVNNGQKPNLSYYRDNNQNEIDLIIQENLKLYLIEIKKGISFNQGHIKSFSQLSKSKYEIGPSCILCTTTKNYALEKDRFVLSCQVI